MTTIRISQADRLLNRKVEEEEEEEEEEEFILQTCIQNLQ